MISLVIVWAAFLLDLLLGDPPQFPHPVRLMGWYIVQFEKVARRLVVSPLALRLAGCVLAGSCVLAFAGITAALLVLLHKISPMVAVFLETLLAYTCLATRSLRNEAYAVYILLQQNNLEGACAQLGTIVSRDTASLSKSEVVRGAVETVAENTSDGIVAPLFYLMLGAALWPNTGIGAVTFVVAYKAASTLDSMVGYKNERYLNFGWASARLDDLLNLLPARLTGILLVWAAWLQGNSAASAWRLMRRDHGAHASPNAGWPEAAVAGALGIQLGGASSYFGKILSKPTIGDATRALTDSDIQAAVGLMICASWSALCLYTLVWCLFV